MEFAVADLPPESRAHENAVVEVVGKGNARLP
jgi:hypothetical protein